MHGFLSLASFVTKLAGVIVSIGFTADHLSRWTPKDDIQGKWLKDSMSTLYPYFRIHPGKEAEFKYLVGRFIERTKTEEECLFYSFSYKDNIATCREGYKTAEGFLNHVNSVADLLGEASAISDVTAIEFHGPPNGVETVRESLTGFYPNSSFHTLDRRGITAKTFSLTEPKCQLYPFFKIHPGKDSEFKALVGEFIEKTSEEKDCLYYSFSYDGDVAMCREAYRSADALLSHFGNVGPILEKAAKIADIQRIEFHGTAKQIATIRGPLTDFFPDSTFWEVDSRGFTADSFA